MNIVLIDADPDLVRYKSGTYHSPEIPEVLHLHVQHPSLFDNPLDIVLCYRFQWGCRYLRVDHRTLVDHVWDDKAIAKLRSGDSETAVALTQLDGLILRGRSLRFADLNESSLPAADLTDTDLSKASLAASNLLGSRLAEAKALNSNLSDAHALGAHLVDVKLSGSDIRNAQLSGADLRFAQLQAADLRGAKLLGADLRGAFLQGADLHGAQLQGADLRDALVMGADMGETRLFGAAFNKGTNLELSDLRKADFSTPPTDDEIAATLGVIPAANQKSVVKQRLSQRPLQVVFAVEPWRQVLVDDPKNPLFNDISTACSIAPYCLIPSPTPAYTSALVRLLAHDLAPENSAIAQGIFRRAYTNFLRTRDAELNVQVLCALIANVQANKVILAPQLKDDLLSTHVTCAPANRVQSPPNDKAK